MKNSINLKKKKEKSEMLSMSAKNQLIKIIHKGKTLKYLLYILLFFFKFSSN